MAVQFSSKAQMQTYFQSQINNLNSKAANTLKSKSGTTYSIERKRELVEAAEAMLMLIQKFILSYYGSYSPTVYNRTGGLFGAVTVEMLSDTKAMVTFDDSVISSRGMNRAWAINEGWQVGSGRNMGIYRWGYYEGFNFMGMALDAARNDPRFEHIEIVSNI